MRVNKKNCFWSFAVCLCAFLGACHHGEKAEAPAIEKVNSDTVRLSEGALKNIVLAKAEMSEFPEMLNLMGRISVPEDRIVVIPARVSGRVDTVQVASGEQVSSGQSLATIFSSDYAVAREEYVQAIELQKASTAPDAGHLLTLAIKKLQNLGLSKRDIEELPQQSSEKMTNFPVRATRSGVVIDKKVIAGNFVNVGDTLFTLGDLGKVWFAGDVYQEDLPKVHKDQEVLIETTNGDKPVFGKVSFISPVIDPTTRTIKIRALMENPGFRLRGDMYVKGGLTLSKKSALLIPTKAILHLQNNTFVFKRGKGNEFQKVPVKLSNETETTAVVASGVSPGEEVVSEGGLLLDAGLSNGDAP